MLWQRSAVLAAVYGAIWWLLTDGDMSSWLLGIPGVALATAASVFLGRKAPFQPLHPLGLARFAPYFLWESLRGGIDVARRAFQPRVKLAPEFVEHETRLPAGAARAFFAVSVSLLPGTLTTDLQHRRVRLHVLDRDVGVPEELQRLESYIAALFGVSLSGEESATKAQDHG